MSNSRLNARLIVAILTSIAQAAVIVAIILWVLPRFGINIPIWGIVVICLAFAAYCITFYRVGSRILRRKAIPGFSNMSGLKGKTVSSLNPQGLIKIQGELWEAKAEDGIIPSGVEVTVIEQNGLTLIVRLSERSTRQASG